MYGWNNYFAAYPEQDFAMVVATNQWDMVPGRNSDAAEIVGAVSAFLRDPKPEEELLREMKVVPRPTIVEPAPRESQGPDSLAWKYSYVIGLVLVDRLLGSLGIEDPLTPAMIRAMEEGVMVRTDVEDPLPVWDPGGFRAGLQDMLGVDMTIDGVRAFLTSDRLRITAEDLAEVGRLMGADGAPTFGAIQ